MAAYTYTKDNQGAQVVFRIYSGAHQVASSRLMVHRCDFESYAVDPSARGQGLSYALTYVMLVYCNKKHYGSPQVSNAHGLLLRALPQVGFHQLGRTRVIKRSEEAASFLCVSVSRSIAECNRKLARHHITLSGPIKSSHGCVIL